MMVYGLRAYFENMQIISYETIIFIMLEKKTDFKWKSSKIIADSRYVKNHPVFIIPRSSYRNKSVHLAEWFLKSVRRTFGNTFYTRKTDGRICCRDDHTIDGFVGI